MSFIASSPNEDLRLIFDCSNNTLTELFCIIKILRFITEPENEMIEVLRNIKLHQLSNKDLEYLYQYGIWTSKTIPIKELILKIYLERRKKYQSKISASGATKYMKKTYKKFEKVDN